jgi:negative regulator of flagellin synthesis FlgM
VPSQASREESKVPMMIISSQQVQNVMKLQQNSQLKKKAGRIAHELKPDKLELSNYAQEIQRTTDLVLKSPNIRADKIDELKKQIQAGDYHRTGAEIASKMVDRSLVDEFAGR